MVAYADVVTQREVLAGLLAEPRIATGIISTGGPAARPYGFKTRARRGRIISAGSPYHAVRSPTGTFLGVVKVAPADRPGVARGHRAAGDARRGTGRRPTGRRSWPSRRQHWHRMLALAELDRAARGARAARARQLDEIALSAESAAELERRRAMAPDDVTALLLVGLIRSGVHVSASHLRSLFWARPLSPVALERAAAEHPRARRGPRAAQLGGQGLGRLLHDVLRLDLLEVHRALGGARGLTPNQVTIISVLIGVLAAAGFATGERPGMVAGALLLYFAFVLDCVDGQLARYTRQFSKLGAWLDSIFDRTKEYVVFAGPGDRREPDRRPGVAAGRRRAGAADRAPRGRLLLSRLPAPGHRGRAAAADRGPVRRAAPGLRGSRSRSTRRRRTRCPRRRRPRPGRSPSSGGSARCGARPTASRSLRWIKKMIAFPIGERFAAISITAAFFSAHTVFIVLLVWGGFAAAYVLTGRILRSLSA